MKLFFVRGIVFVCRWVWMLCACMQVEVYEFPEDILCIVVMPSFSFFLVTAGCFSGRARTRERPRLATLLCCTLGVRGLFLRSEIS